MAEEASALRDSPAVSGGDGSAEGVERVRGMLEEADQITRSGESAAEYAGVAGTIHDVVDAAEFEPPIERHGAVVNETPLTARDPVRGVEGTIAHGHERSRGRCGHRPGRRGGRGRLAVPEAGLLIGNEVPAHQADDRGAMICRDRHVHAHASLGDVPLPAHPKQ